MSVTLMNPEGMLQVDLYHQVSVASGSRMVFIAGQVASGPDGEIVGEADLARQVEQCYLHLATALGAVGASFADVAKLTAYLVDWSPEKLPLLLDGIARASATLGDLPAPPFTGIGVATLAEPGLLVEVEAIAVVA